MMRLPPFLKYPLRRRRLDRPPGFGDVGEAMPPGFGDPPVRGPWPARRRAALAVLATVFVVVPMIAGVVVYNSTVAASLVSDAAFSVLAMTVGVVAPSASSATDRADSDHSSVSGSRDAAAASDASRFENSDLDVPEWSSKERVNVILLGTDRREDEPDITRTDTILIVSIDPVTKSAGVLSLPRDLWVNIPGYGFERINTAFEIGEYQKKGGGPALLRRTLEGLLGVPMHHYALVGFTGFRKVVDQLGGVVIDVERPFRDDEFPQGNYGTRRIIFQAGLQRLDGEQALWYVRSRHADSDFGRNRRQRQFLLAVRQQALQLNMLPKAPAMLASVMDSVKTDLRPSEILSLAKVAKDVETSRLVSRAVDESMVNPWMTPGGAAVLLPEPSAIRQVVQEVFGTPGKLPTLPIARPQAPVATPDVAQSTIASDPRTPAATSAASARTTATTIVSTPISGYWATPTRAPGGPNATPTQATLGGVPGTIMTPIARSTGAAGVAVTPATPGVVSGTPVATVPGRVAAVPTNAGVTPPSAVGAPTSAAMIVTPVPGAPIVQPTAASGTAVVRPAAPSPAVATVPVVPPTAPAVVPTKVPVAVATPTAPPR